MSKTVIVVEPDRPVAEAARIMIDHKIGALPVVEEGRLVGIITESDFVRAMAGSAGAREPNHPGRRRRAGPCHDLRAAAAPPRMARGDRRQPRGGAHRPDRAPRPVLAIVDRQLPDGDGLDVLSAALAITTPVIMVTGYGSATTRRLALEEGASASSPSLIPPPICWSWCAGSSAMLPGRRPTVGSRAGLSRRDPSRARAVLRGALGRRHRRLRRSLQGGRQRPRQPQGRPASPAGSSRSTPTRAVVQGLPAVASILDVGEPDRPGGHRGAGAAVLPALKQCVTKGVPAAVVISAGFREAGDEGRAREAELRAWLARGAAAGARPQLPRLDPPRPPAQPDASRPGMPPAGRPRLLLALGRARHGDPRLVARARPRLLPPRQPRQPGRRRRDGPARRARRRSRDARDPRLPRGRRRRPGVLRRARGGGRPQAVRADEGGPLGRGRPRRVLAHRRAGRLRPRLRRRRPPGRRAARDDARGAVRRRARRWPPDARRRAGA